MAKYLDKSGLQTLWAKIKNYADTAVGTGITEKLGKQNGIATLDANGKLPSAQLTDLKTINGESIVGTGNITIDLGIYQVVETLPESNQNPNKIYLVLSKTSGTQNLYTEFIWVNNAWETLGEYKAEVQLEDYLKTADLKEEGKKAGLVTFDDVATSSKNGLVSKELAPILEKILPGSQTAYPMYIVQDIYAEEKDTFINIGMKGIGLKSSDNSLTNDKKQVFGIYGATSEKAGLLTSAQFNKLENITPEATKDEAISSTELNEILV